MDEELFPGSGLPGDVPDAGGGELEEVAVGVADVVAADGGLTGGRRAPVDGALDGEAVVEEAALPGVDVLGGDGEGEVDVALGVVGEAAPPTRPPNALRSRCAGARLFIGRRGGFPGGALAEKEEDLAIADFEGGEAVVRLDV